MTERTTPTQNTAAIAPIAPGLVLQITPPRLRKSLLERERLRLLRENADDDVEMIIIEAPAGYGKTALMTQWRLDWLKKNAWVAWFELSSDESTASLIRGVAEGLRRASGVPTFGHDALEIIQRAGNLTESATALLAEIAESDHTTTLILDNAERPSGKDFLELCNYLLHNLPPNLKIVVASRKPRPLATADLMTHGGLLYLSSKELAFTLVETQAFLDQRLSNKASMDFIAQVHELTEGWPMGLQLVTNAIGSATDPAQALKQFFSAPNEHTQHLLARFIEQLPEEQRDFVLRCALLDALHPELCAVITDLSLDQVTQLLQQLRWHTPLLTLVENSDWLGLHPLIKEYLRTVASQHFNPKVLQQVHQKAWHWLAENGGTEPAARHALAAGFKQEAFALIANSLYDSCMKDGHYGMVADWLRKMPNAEILRNNPIRLIAGWQAALIGNWQKAKHYVGGLVTAPTQDKALLAEAIAILAIAYAHTEQFDIAEEYCSAYPTDMPDSLATRSLTHLQALFTLYRGHTEESRHLLNSIPKDDRFFAQETFHINSLGQVYLWEGRPALADDTVRRQHAVCELTAGRRNELTISLASVLAFACWDRDQRERARALLAFSFKISAQAGMFIWNEYGYLVQAYLASNKGDVPRAFAVLEDLDNLGIQQHILSVRLLSFAERIRLHAANHSHAQCRRLLEQMECLFAEELPKKPAILHPLLELYRNLAHSYSCLSSDTPETAEPWLMRAWECAQQLNRGREMVQIQAMQALLCDLKQESPSMLLSAALARAQSGGQIRVFADTLPEITDLISRWSITENARTFVDPDFILQVLGAFDDEPSAALVPKVTEFSPKAAFLTPKESEVLKLLAAGMPNKRIALALNLSSETIKWHMKKLFIKLNAGTRQHAVERAHLLGLL